MGIEAHSQNFVLRKLCMSEQPALSKRLLKNREDFLIEGIGVALSADARGDSNSVVALSVSGFGHNEKFNLVTVQ